MLPISFDVKIFQINKLGEKENKQNPIEAKVIIMKNETKIKDNLPKVHSFKGEMKDVNFECIEEKEWEDVKDYTEEIFKKVKKDLVN